MFSRFCLAVTSGDLNAVGGRFTSTVVSAACVFERVCVVGSTHEWTQLAAVRLVGLWPDY